MKNPITKFDRYMNPEDRCTETENAQTDFLCDNPDASFDEWILNCATVFLKEIGSDMSPETFVEVNKKTLAEDYFEIYESLKE